MKIIYNNIENDIQITEDFLEESYNIYTFKCQNKDLWKYIAQECDIKLEQIKISKQPIDEDLRDDYFNEVTNITYFFKIVFVVIINGRVITTNKHIQIRFYDSTYEYKETLEKID